MTTKNMTYQIKTGDDCSRIAYDWAKRTFSTRENKIGFPLFDNEGSFSNLIDYGQTKIGITSDGIGTKIEIGERMEIYDTLGFDLTAMVTDDLAANGLEPVNLSNILDVDVLDLGIVDSLMKGLHDAARVAGLSVVGGEIAELSERVTGFGDKMHFNWSATAVGVLPANATIIDGLKIKPGDTIISLNSNSFRSNGFTLVRNILKTSYGSDWHLKAFDRNQSWGEAILTPSIIYSPLITKLQSQNIPLHGVAHITGGSFQGKLGRVLKTNKLGATLSDLFTPEKYMLELQKLGDIPNSLAYKYWNMGNGMLLICPKDQADMILSIASEMNYKAQTAGEITASPEIKIQTKTSVKETLTYKYF